LEWAEESRLLKSEIHHLELQITGKRKDLERFDDELKRIEQRIKSWISVVKICIMRKTTP